MFSLNPNLEQNDIEISSKRDCEFTSDLSRKKLHALL